MLRGKTDEIQFVICHRLHLWSMGAGIEIDYKDQYGCD